ncbi:Hypothetical predicted protein [Mytilus galloprovincialis]|uniref:Reverse transcriptase domain-containing protein n=1 Tax=Mytilus galloprovincialis TaxID=29158 RepID=A0A8B6HJ61_MYTGA|nr:Hypothetical predicted protein [Mytilus galloprovincialis]
MPTQRSRVRRRVAPTDLRDVDPVPVIPDIVAPQPRRRKRARANTTQVPADRPVQPVQQPAESIPQIPVTHPSADQIAAAMISQLKDSGVQLTVNREPVTTNFLTNYLTDGVSHDNTGRRDLHNAEPIQIAESGPNSSYVLAPPLVTDPDVLAYTGQDTVEGASQALGIDNSAMGKTATYILQNTLPLGFNVDEKIRRDIWSDLYLDLIKLLPNFNEEENDDILFSTKSVKISTTAKAKQLTNIHLWTAAFDIFMSIHHVKYPHLILSLIKYAYNIRAMSKQFGFHMARSYDEAFRRVRKVMRFDWSNVNDDLWRTAFYEHFNSSQTSNGNTNNRINRQVGTSPFPRQAQQQNNPFPMGYCWAYCRSGECANIATCKLKHECVRCSKKHATVSCREGSSKFNKSAYTSKGLVPKKEEGSFRLIHDLSFPKGDSVNSWTPIEFTSVSYQNIETVIDLVQEFGLNCLMSKADILEAFRLVPVHSSEYHLLGFKWQNLFYYDAALPMGASASCQLFECFSTALQWILNTKFEINGMSHLLDDFFFVGKAGTNECSIALNTFLALAEKLGVPIKDEKTQTPTTCITIYGIEIDSQSMIARLPQDKIEKVLGLLTKFKWVSSESLKLYSDAAGVYGGFAAVFGSKWFSGQWPPELKDLHITVKELFPIVLAIEIWGSPSNCSLVKSKSSYGSTASLESVTAQLLQASLSHSTRQSYKRMLNVFQQFCKEKFPVVQPFPSTSIMIAHFISFLFLKNYQPSTIASYISAISFVHKLNFWSDPTDSFFIKKIIKGAQNLRSSSDNRLPITKEILSKLVAAIPVVVQSPYNQILLRAMMSLAFYCFLRIGEMAVKSESRKNNVIQLSDLNIEFENKVSKRMTVTMRNYKHSDMQPKTISIDKNTSNIACPVMAMSSYLNLVKHNSGPLFQFPCGTPVSYAFFSASLKAVLNFVGLNTQLYKGHSFRIGAATSAAAKGVSLEVIQQMGRWKSNAVKNYIRLHNF